MGAKEKRVGLGVLGVTAAIYNPILRVHATCEIWSIVNLITIGLTLASIFVLNSDETV